LEQAKRSEQAHAEDMKLQDVSLQNLKIALSTSWLFVIAIAGLMTSPSTASGWTALAMAAIAPVAGMWWLWNDPEPTMSDTIRRGRG
jgi:hypothetical protein